MQNCCVSLSDTLYDIWKFVQMEYVSIWFFCIRLRVVCCRSSLDKVLCKYPYKSSVASSRLDWCRCLCPMLYFACPNLLSANIALSLTMIFLVESGGVKLYSAHANTAPGLSLHFAEGASPHPLVPSILCHQFISCSTCSLAHWICLLDLLLSSS